MKKLIVIGAGPGNKKYIIPAAMEAVDAADIVIGDRRLLAAFELEPDDVHIWVMEKMMLTLHKMASIDEGSEVAILVSGDPAFYSMLNLLKRTYPDVPITVVPGLSTFSVFAAAIGENLADAKLMSAHGREMTDTKLLELIKTYGKVCMLCDAAHDPSWIASALCRAGFGHIYMAVGSQLTYPEESIKEGVVSDFTEKKYSGMSVVLIKDMTSKTDVMMAPVAWRRGHRNGWLTDADFIRNKTPMTAEELRWIVMGKLQLSPEETFWDIGAGTGSISIEAALNLTQGHVYAFEKNTTALAVLIQNKDKFNCQNLTLITGEAPESLTNFPAPDAVFIGGAGKRLKEILTYLSGMHKKMRIIIAAVTIETQGDAFKLCSEISQLKSPEMITVSIGKSRQLGSYHMIDQGHQVALIMTEIEE